MTAILSLSLLTVMAGAAVAPALGKLQEHFADSAAITVQMIISMPALFILLSSFVFPTLCAKLKSKTIVLTGLLLYVLGGCGAALFDNIFAVLVFRALVGCGVGLIMPMSTGLLSFYYPPEQIDRLMGLSSAMNQMGGAIATYMAGMLATISWRAVFMVYLMGIVSLVPVLLFLPNDRLTKKAVASVANPADASDEAGIMSQQAIATVMALMDVIAFVGGLCYIKIKIRMGNNAHFAAPLLFCAGYLILSFASNAALSVAGSFMVGFANGAGIPCIIASASRKAGQEAVSTVMPLLSGAMYIAQFLSPFIMSVVTAFTGDLNLSHLPFVWAAVLGLILTFLAAGMKNSDRGLHREKNEA